MRLATIKHAIRADLNSGTERGRLIRSAGATAALKIGATLLAFGASLLYARVLGPHDYGLYAYVMAWVAILAIPTGLGLPQYLVREGAKAPESLRWLRHWGDQRVLVTGIAVGGLMAGAAFLPAAADAKWLFVVAAPLPLLNNLRAIRGALLQACGRIAHSQWPTLLLSPALVLIVLATVWIWQGDLQPLVLVLATTATALVSLFINGRQLGRTVLNHRDRPVQARTRAALPFMWLGMLYLLNNKTDLIMLGSLSGAHNAGIYAVAARAALLVVLLRVAVHMVVAPQIARLHQESSQILLQRLVTGAARRILVLSTPVAIALIVAARPLLANLYGAEYADGAMALRILASAQLITVAAGPMDLLLNMTGHEKSSALSAGVSAALNLILNAALIPLYGVNGAAMATGISIAVCNLLLWHQIRRHLKLRPTSFGI